MSRQQIEESKDTVEPIYGQENTAEVNPENTADKEANHITESVKKGLSWIATGMIAIKDMVCFTGLWIWPVVWIIAGISVSDQPHIYLGISFFVVVGTLSLCQSGKRHFSFLDTFCVLDLENNLRNYQNEKAKDPPLHPKLLMKRNEAGLFFGEYKGKTVGIPVKEQDIYHIAVCGGSGSGKTSTTIIPGINRYTGSMLIVDIKDTDLHGGELYRKTKPHGARYMLQPGSPYSCGYDPFYVLKYGDAKTEIRKITHYMIPSDPTKPNDFWIVSAQRLLTALLFYYYDLGMSFCESCRNIFSLDCKTIFEQIQGSSCSFAKASISSFVIMADETLGSIASSVCTACEIFAADNAVMDMLSKNSIVTPELLLQQGTQIYICIPESKLDIYRPLTQIIISQFVGYFEDLPPSKAPNVPIVFLLEEFARIGSFPDLCRAMCTIRSRSVRIIIVFQSNAQLDHLYAKQAKTLLDNAAIKLILSANDKASCEYYSKLAGTYTTYQKSYTKGKSSSRNLSPVEKPKIKPEDMVTLPQREQTLLLSPWGTYFIDKVPYYLRKNKLW